jgi:hypothetical protein
LTERIRSESGQGSDLTGAEFHYNGRFNTDSMAQKKGPVKPLGQMINCHTQKCCTRIYFSPDITGLPL